MQAVQIEAVNQTTLPLKQEDQTRIKSDVRKEILTLIAICGEIPKENIGWLGEEDATMKIVYNSTGVVMVSGVKGNSIKGSKARKCKGEYLIMKQLKRISEPAANYWFSTYGNTRSRTEPSRILRAHKLARAVMVMREARINCCPWYRDISQPQFFTSKEIKASMKQLGLDEKNTQNVGILKLNQDSFIVFNFHGLPRKFDERIEQRFRISGSRFLENYDGTTHKLEKELIIASCQVMSSYIAKTQQKETDIFKLEDKYFLPFEKRAATILKIWQVSDWESKLVTLEFPENVRLSNNALFNAEKDINEGVQRAAHWYDLKILKLTAILSEASNHPENRYIILTFQSTREVIEALCKGVANVEVISRSEDLILRQISTR